MASPRPAVPLAVSVTAKVDQRVIYNDLSNLDQFSEDIKELVNQSRGSNRSQDSLHPTGLKLLARVFGDECTGLDFQLTTAGWQNDNKVVSGGGGWLKKLCIRFAVVSPSRTPDSVRTQLHGLQSLPAGTSKLMSHFLPRSQYLDVMASNGRLDVKIRLDRFPVKAQICIRQAPYYECVSSPNQVVYFPPYFKTASSEQYQPLLRSEADPCMMIKFHEFFFVCMLRYPKDNKGVFDIGSTQSRDGASSNTSTYIGTSDVRSTGKAGTSFGKLHEVLRSSAVGCLNRLGLFGLVDGNPYLCLLFENLKDFIRHATTSSLGAGASGAGGTSSSASAVGSAASTPSRAGQLPAEVSLSAAGELFIRLMAEYWMDSATLVRRNYAQGAIYKSQLNKTLTHYSAVDPTSRHLSPTDVLTLDNNSMSWSVATMQCTYIVLARMLSDPFLADQFSCIAQTNGVAFESAHLMASYAKASGYARASSQSTHQASVVCPPALSLVQQPLFDMLRTVFSKADAATGAEWELHALAVECWLLWIQPWKAISVAEGYSLEKVDTSTSAYNRDVWLPYIAANLHFYTTLLASFLQLTAKVDLSVVEEPGIVHLYLLEKVLLAFAPLVSDIDALVKDFRAWYPEHSRDGVGHSRPTAAATSHMHTPTSQRTASHFGASRQLCDTPLALLVSMRAQHQWLFPDASIDKLPDFGILSVRDHCRQCAQKIIATLYAAMRDCTPKKKFSAVELAAETIDMLSAVEHWAGGAFSLTKLLAMTGYSTAVRSDDAMLTRLKEDIAKLELVTECGSATSGAAGRAATGCESPAAASPGGGPDLRVTDETTGHLKSYGRWLLQSGKKVPLDSLRWFEDVLDMPLCSYEVQCLVPLLVDASTALNVKYGLPQTPEAARWTWKKVAIHLHEHLEVGKLPVRAKYEELCRLMRFNLRPLADVRVVSGLTLLLCRNSCMFYLLGTWNYALIAHAMCLFYYNTTNLPPLYYTSLFALATGAVLFEARRLVL